MYDAEFPEGSAKKYSDNIISMNIISQIESYGHNSNTLDGILDYNQDNSAVSPKKINDNQPGSKKSREKNNRMEIPHTMERWYNNLETPQDSEGVQPS